MKGNTSMFLVAGVFVFVVIVGYLLYSQNIFGTGWGLDRTSVSSTETGDIVSKDISLEVSSPNDGAVLSSGSVVVKGKTSPNAEVFVNDKETKADSSGNFSVSLTLDEGENQIIVLVNDSLGNSAEKDMAVTVETFK